MRTFFLRMMSDVFRCSLDVFRCSQMFSDVFRCFQMCLGYSYYIFSGFAQDFSTMFPGCSDGSFESFGSGGSCGSSGLGVSLIAWVGNWIWRATKRSSCCEF